MIWDTVGVILYGKSSFVLTLRMGKFNEGNAEKSIIYKNFSGGFNLKFRRYTLLFGTAELCVYDQKHQEQRHL